MQNFIDFIRRYNAVFWFLFFQAISVTLIFNYQPFQQSSILNTSNRISGAMLEQSDAFWEYWFLQRVNDSLHTENARLYEMVFNAEAYGGLSPVFQENDTTEKAFEFIPAGVVRNTIYRQRNYFTIDKGTADGVEKEMGVLSNSGVAGIVVDVSRNYAVCISLLHINSRISGRLENSHYTGQVVWKGRNVEYAFLEDIPLHVQVEEKEMVYTSGYSAIFPKGIPIGEVASVRQIDGHNFWEIRLNLNTFFQSLDYVYVIKNIDREEISELEEAYYVE